MLCGCLVKSLSNQVPPKVGRQGTLLVSCTMSILPSSDCVFAVVILVGNKTDLAEDRAVSQEEGLEYATRHAAIPVCL